MILGGISVLGLLATWHAEVPLGAMATACIGGVVAGVIAWAWSEHRFARLAMPLASTLMITAVPGRLSDLGAAAWCHLLFAYAAAIATGGLLIEGIRAVRDADRTER